MADIGKLKRIPLRSVFPHEAHDFTVWLQENIDYISEEVGLHLDSEEVLREQAAGTFRVDLVTKDSEGRKVIIENQYGKSNHDHLGKILTYMASFDAKVAIWICEDPRPEHSEAINFLNRMPEVYFYLLRIEALQIEDSKPAINLNMVAGPSELTEAVRHASASQGEAKAEQLTYWTRFCELDNSQRKLFASLRPQESNWIALRATLPTGCAFSNVAMKRAIRSELYIDGGDAEVNLAVFDFLASKRSQIESKCECEINWDSLEGRRACRISITSDRGGLREGESWDTLIPFHLEQSYMLYDALKPHFAAADKAGRAVLKQRQEADEESDS